MAKPGLLASAAARGLDQAWAPRGEYGGSIGLALAGPSRAKQHGKARQAWSGPGRGGPGRVGALNWAAPGPGPGPGPPTPTHNYRFCPEARGACPAAGLAGRADKRTDRRTDNPNTLAELVQRQGVS